MTIAVSIQVNDGLVLAADSATTMSNAQGPVNVYDNANKVFNLRKGSPIGVTTWGCGSINGASIATLTKDFRKLITDDGEHKIDPNGYTLEDVANKFFKFIYNEHYVPYFYDRDKKLGLGFIIGGYSTGSKLPEQWCIKIADETGICDGPSRLSAEGDYGSAWFGVPDPLMRLLRGFSGELPLILMKVGIPQERIEQEIIPLLAMELNAPLVQPSMPIQDAIDLAHFMVDLTAKYIKYSPLHNIVGGPIEIAAITKHEGFKWIQRKLYFRESDNA